MKINSLAETAHFLPYAPWLAARPVAGRLVHHGSESAKP
jgi:hypothetical protein